MLCRFGTFGVARKCERAAGLAAQAGQAAQFFQFTFLNFSKCFDNFFSYNPHLCISMVGKYYQSCLLHSTYNRMVYVPDRCLFFL